MKSLQTARDATQEQVALLTLQVSTRERELTALQSELRQLQSRYLKEIGPLYDELIPLDAAVAEAEIEAGLRAPEPESPQGPEGDEGPEEGQGPEEGRAAPCGPASEPSADLRRMFRDVARAVHPDRSSHHDVDDRTRYRRHSLMAEANRAYAERDEDRLRLILRAWHLDPDLVIMNGNNPDDERVRLGRRASALTARLAEIDAAFAQVRASAIARLKTKLDDAHSQGWDLLAEMKRQVEREIAMGRATLRKLERRQKR